MVSRRIGVEERRARLASRHHLHPDHRASSPVEAARHQVGLHTSDPATPFLSAWARVDDLAIPDMEVCLYEDPSLFRILGMRRTLFAVPADLIPLLHHGCAVPLAAPERRRLAGYLEAEGITDDGHGWIERVGDATVEAITNRGQALATELREDVPELKETLTFGKGPAPIYRTHVSVMHFWVPMERSGVPWPVIQCPAGMDPGPCRITLYKDPSATPPEAYEFATR